MKSQHTYSTNALYIVRQRGLVLFFALIALLVLSLAAVALIRSVDTNTTIAGNLAFKQSATTSGDAGIEAAITWLDAKQIANDGLDVLSDTSHAFNIDDATNGYYSSFDPALNLFADATWGDNSSASEITDSSGNKIRYIIQRLCRNANVAVKDADCLASAAALDQSGQAIPTPQSICKGPGCLAVGQTPQVRITTRTIAPRNNVSYLQALTY